MDVNECELHGLYSWVDSIPISRPKRSLARDFSDGVPMAEVMHHYFPKYVHMHNYTPASAFNKKLGNWQTLNSKVFKILGFSVEEKDIEDICNAKPGAIERLLKLVRIKISEFISKQSTKQGSASSDSSNEMEEFCFSPSKLTNRNSDDIWPTAPPPPPPSKIPKPASESGKESTEPDTRLRAFIPERSSDTSQDATPRSDRSSKSIPRFRHSKTPLPSPVSQLPVASKRGTCSLSPTPKFVGKARRNLSDHTFKIDESKAKDLILSEIQERNMLLEAKIEKLEALLKLKDAKILSLLKKLELHSSA